MAKVFLYFIFFINGFAAYSQLLPFKIFGTKEGLIDQQVTAITQDERGLLWIGTPFGLNWFDGTHFYTPTIVARTCQLFIQNFYQEPD